MLGLAPRLSGGVAGAAAALQSHCRRSLGALASVWQGLGLGVGGWGMASWVGVLPHLLFFGVKLFVLEGCFEMSIWWDGLVVWIILVACLHCRRRCKGLLFFWISMTFPLAKFESLKQERVQTNLGVCPPIDSGSYHPWHPTEPGSNPGDLSSSSF